MNSQDHRHPFVPILLVVAVLIFVFGQRFAIHIGAFELPIVVPVIFCIMAFFLITNFAAFSPLRILFYTAGIILVLISTIINQLHLPIIAFTSLFYLIVLYFPLTITAQSNTGFRTILSTYQNAMYIAAFLGIIQLITQIAGIHYQDYLEVIAPSWIRSQFNTSIPIVRGATIYKANGLFFLEPSFFSKHIAIAILLEIGVFRRFRRIPILILSLLFTFSGTGIIVLLTGLFILTFRLKLKTAVITLLALAIPTTVFLLSGYGEIAIQRTREFSRIQGSGYVRFIAPYTAYKNVLNHGNITTGYGPGSVHDELEQGKTGKTYVKAHVNFIIKLAYEYGVFSALIFSLYIILCFFARVKYLFMTVSFFIMYAFLATSLLEPHTLYFCYLFVMFFPKEDCYPPMLKSRAMIS